MNTYDDEQHQATPILAHTVVKITAIKFTLSSFLTDGLLVPVIFKPTSAISTVRDAISREPVFTAALEMRVSELQVQHVK